MPGAMRDAGVKVDGVRLNVGHNVRRQESSGFQRASAEPFIVLRVYKGVDISR